MIHWHLTPLHVWITSLRLGGEVESSPKSCGDSELDLECINLGLTEEWAQPLPFLSCWCPINLSWPLPSLPSLPAAIFAATSPRFIRFRCSEWFVFSSAGRASLTRANLPSWEPAESILLSPYLREKVRFGRTSHGWLDLGPCSLQSKGKRALAQGGTDPLPSSVWTSQLVIWPPMYPKTSFVKKIKAENSR